MIYTIAQLENWDVHRYDEKTGRWIPCRPVPAPWRRRLKAAWLVLTGRADAVVWQE